MTDNKEKGRAFLRPLSLAIATVLATTSNAGAFSGIVSQAAGKSQQVISGTKSADIQDQLVLDSSNFQSNANKVAYHYSHQSHSSHMSHQSHQSHYSSRW